jgi:hypothetical protein
LVVYPPSFFQPAWTVRPGRSGLDGPAWTARPGRPGLDGPAWTARPGRPGLDGPAWTARPGRPGLDGPAWTVRPGRSGLDCPAWTVQPGRSSLDLTETKSQSPTVGKWSIANGQVEITKHQPIHGHMARGIHGLPKVSRGLPMPDPSKPCRRPPLKQPYGRFRSGCPQ